MALDIDGKICADKIVTDSSKDGPFLAKETLEKLKGLSVYERHVFFDLIKQEYCISCGHFCGEWWTQNDLHTDYQPLNDTNAS